MLRFSRKRSAAERVICNRLYVREISAQIVGVDEAKPKSEYIEAACLRVEASKLNLESNSKELEIAQIKYDRQKRDYEGLKKLWKDKAI